MYCGASLAVAASLNSSELTIRAAPGPSPASSPPPPSAIQTTTAAISRTARTISVACSARSERLTSPRQGRGADRADLPLAAFLAQRHRVDGLAGRAGVDQEGLFAFGSLEQSLPFRVEGPALPAAGWDARRTPRAGRAPPRRRPRGYPRRRGPRSRSLRRPGSARRRSCTCRTRRRWRVPSCRR